MATNRNETIDTCGAIASRRGAVRLLGGVAAAVLATNRAFPAAAKRQHHRKKPTNANVTTVTRSFANTDPITFNIYGSATPFPSRIQVSGFENATIADVDVVLNRLSHRTPEDIDIMLVAPDGRNILMMSDISSANGAKGVTFHLDDEAGTGLPYNLVSGTYRPTDVTSGGPDVFDTTVAPVPSRNVALSTFDGGDPNGEWRLFVRTDNTCLAGLLSEGWELQITATIPATKKKKKHKKKR